MKTLKKTYRAFAAIALIAMVANVLLPASAAAAGYICSTEYAGTIGGRVACCSTHTGQTDGVNIHEQNPTRNHAGHTCSLREIFEHALSMEVSQTPVMLPNAQPAFAVLPPLTTVQILFKRYSRDPFSSEIPVIFSSPPIFLLNSSFLN